jgi:hypothetical protein
MLAQRLLEGEAYVTVSLIPYMIYKIRKGLQLAITDVESSHHVTVTGQKMLQKMNEFFRSGDEGTVANEYNTEGVMPSKRYSIAGVDGFFTGSKNEGRCWDSQSRQRPDLG